MYYVPGKLVHFADMLSRNSLKETEHDDDMMRMVHSVSRHLPMSIERKSIFRNNTCNDPILSKLIKFYHHGWPKVFDKQLKPYYNLRNILYLQDGLLFVGDKIIVPDCLKSYVLQLAHNKSHCGINKTTNLIKNLFYWPGMKDSIVKFIMQCRSCEKYSKNNFKEPLLPHTIPKERFYKVGCDILDFMGKTYLVIVDYFSHWLELLLMKDKTSNSVINSMQDVFIRFGYPVELISDNVPFASYECKQYFKSKDITLITSTPRYPRSNGLAEKGVHICKQILRKCCENNEDFRDGIMDYNNTPLSGLDVTPSQILNSRRVRTTLPCTSEYLKPKIQCNIYKDLLAKQSIYKNVHDKYARKSLCNFNVGDQVVYRHNNVWRKAVIINKCKQPRSFMIKNCNGTILRRNSSQMKFSYTKPNVESNCYTHYFNFDSFVKPTLLPNDCNFVPDNPSVSQSKPSTTDNGFRTKSGRLVKPPQRLNL